jgi:phage gp36-like protein
MFITIEELKTVAYEYQIIDIVEEDETIVEIAIDASIEEIKSYLAGRYDTINVFNKQGSERNRLIVELTKDIALWQIIRLSNPDILFDRVKDRYDRAIDYLNRVAKGLLSPTLPLLTDSTGEETTPLKFGSMPKQQYDY